MARGTLLLVAAATLFPVGEATAQTSPGAPIGFDGRSAASGFHAFYQPQNFLPIAAPVDFGAPDALTTINTGPVSFARASVADPGDLLASPETLVTLAYEDWEPGTIPPYPYRIEANSSIGKPTAESNPGPGLNARVNADDTGSRAQATMPAFVAAPILSAGSMSAATSTTLDNDSVVVKSHSELGQVDLLGVLRIDSLVTDLEAVSSGAEIELSGGTIITGAFVLGQPVTIDANGVRAEPGYSGPSPAVEGLNELLASAGITVTLSSPVDQSSGRQAERVAAGLRIDLVISEETLPVLESLGDVTDIVGQVLDEVAPDAGLGGMIGVTGITHVISLELARGQVGLTVVPTPDIDLPPFTTDTPPAASAPQLGSLAPVAPPTPSATPSLPPASVTDVSQQTPSEQPILSQAQPIGLGEGVGAIALFALVVQPFIGSRIGRAAAALIAGNDAGACPREGL